jgi:hypothetical protein
LAGSKRLGLLMMLASAALSLRSRSAAFFWK